MGERSLNLLACPGPSVCKVYYHVHCTVHICHNQSCPQVNNSFCFCSLQMHCKFTIYNVPWEKRKELLNHECVGIKEEQMLSCERSQPAVNTSEPVEQDNFVTEFADEQDNFVTDFADEVHMS